VKDPLLRVATALGDAKVRYCVLATHVEELRTPLGGR